MAAKKKTSRKDYGSSAQEVVSRVMAEQKAGTLRSGRSKKKVNSKKQAIAIALSEARAAGTKVAPSKKPLGRKKASKRRTA